uniref:Uncharacterized protein n=1 Tax=Oryza barthii TaxID=65489 RepID=A0A0D3GZ85_9ORYZ
MSMRRRRSSRRHNNEGGERRSEAGREAREMVVEQPMIPRETPLQEPLIFAAAVDPCGGDGGTVDHLFLHVLSGDVPRERIPLHPARPSRSLPSPATSASSRDPSQFGRIDSRDLPRPAPVAPGEAVLHPPPRLRIPAPRVSSSAFSRLLDATADRGLSELAVCLHRNGFLPKNLLSIRSLTVVSLNSCGLPRRLWRNGRWATQAVRAASGNPSNHSNSHLIGGRWCLVSTFGGGGHGRRMDHTAMSLDWVRKEEDREIGEETWVPAVLLGHVRLSRAAGRPAARDGEGGGGADEGDGQAEELACSAQRRVAGERRNVKRGRGRRGRRKRA